MASTPTLALLALFSAVILAVAACASDRATAEAPLAGMKVTSEPAGTVLVLAAASLTDVLTEAAVKFKTETGIEVKFSFGGSDSLATQLRRGAPGDVVIFAGAGPLDGLEKDGIVLKDSRRDIASNRLVIIAPARSGLKLASLGEIATGYSGRVAIADPRLAPAGRYAQAALEKAGVWAALGPRLIPSLDVRNTAAAVASGNAEFGFVYETDVAAVKGVDVVMAVPRDAYPQILYPASVVAGSEAQALAGRFLEYLVSQEAAGLFGKYGFRPPEYQALLK
ncbi:MAG: molybdate ABC transporter substrate-binding protein [Dehalococcoidia bacterium]|nr:molybdate ABC transporter substrate-binding protein [Dehalococcoidia bacterium]